MGVFFCLFIYIWIVALLTSRIKDNSRKRLMQALWVGLGLWLVLALRDWTVGQDLYNDDAGFGYVTVFQEFKGVSILDAALGGVALNYEPGFALFDWIIANFISDNPQAFIAISSLIEIGLIGYTFYRHSRDIIFSYIVFACFGMYIFGFSGIRQAMAFSITFFSFNYLYNKKPWKFFALVILAFFFHSSAIVFAAVWFIRNKSLTHQIGVIYAVSILLSVPFIGTLLTSIANSIFSGGKYSDYDQDGGSAITMFLVYGAIFVGSFFFKEKSQDKQKLAFYRYMALFSFIGQAAGVFSAGSITRIAFYFSIFYPLLMPELVQNTSERHVLTVLGCVLFVIFFYLTVHNGYMGVVPYNFFWEFNRY